MGEPAPGAFFYSLHGLCLRSNRPLRDLAPAPTTSEPALTFWSGPLALLRQRHAALNWAELDALDPAHPHMWRPAAGSGIPLLYWMGGQDLQLLAILAATGDHIDLGWRGLNGVAGEEVAESIVDYVIPNLLGIALRLSGRIVLHGNAVAANGTAIAWVGHKGAGKSTLAAAFVAAGFPLLSDDQFVVHSGAAFIGIAPGVRRLHLGAESFATLAGSPGRYRLNQPFGAQAKGFVAVDNGDDAATTGWLMPLSALYVLQPRQATTAQITIEQPAPTRQLHCLLTHCFGRRRVPLDAVQQAAEFRTIGQLVGRLPVRTLTIPDNLACLTQVVRTLVATLSEHG